MIYFNLPDKTENIVLYSFLTCDSEAMAYDLAMVQTGMSYEEVQELHMLFTNLITAMKQHDMVAKQF